MLNTYLSISFTLFWQIGVICRKSHILLIICYIICNIICNIKYTKISLDMISPKRDR